MLTPNIQEREALRTLWSDGHSAIAAYLMRCREEARDVIERTEGKERDEATGEAKMLKELLVVMSGMDKAREVKRRDEA